MVRVPRRKWLAGAAVSLALVAVGAPTAHAAPPPSSDFVLTPIVADAGYFQVDGTCPAKTVFFQFLWNGAPNGKGRGEIARRSGPVSLRIRMLAATAQGSITVTLKCLRANGKTVAQLGPTVVASGNELLPVPENSGTGRRIVYEMSAQQLWAIEADGTVARTYLVSGRRKGMLNELDQTGTFAIEKKITYWCLKAACHWFLAFHHATHGWIGMHAIPVHKKKPDQKDSELGQPRSGGCVRASDENAFWMWNWGQIGDPVIVVA